MIIINKFVFLGNINSLHTWEEGSLIVSGSNDKTARFWDLRVSASINVVPSPHPGSAFLSVCLNPSGHLMASGHADANVMLWDVRRIKSLQHFRPHTYAVGSVR